MIVFVYSECIWIGWRYRCLSGRLNNSTINRRGDRLLRPFDVRPKAYNIYNITLLCAINAYNILMECNQLVPGHLDGVHLHAYAI